MRLLTKLAAAAGSFNIGWLSKGPTLQALKDAYVLDHPRQEAPYGYVADNGRRAMETAVEFFVEIIGDKDVKRISEADVQNYVAVLQQVPRYHIRRGRPVPVMEAVSRNNEAAEPEPTISPKTVRKWLWEIARLMGWAQVRGIIPFDPTVQASKELDGRVRAAASANTAAQHRLRLTRYMEVTGRQSGKASSADEKHPTPPMA